MIEKKNQIRFINNVLITTRFHKNRNIVYIYVYICICICLNVIFTDNLSPI